MAYSQKEIDKTFDAIIKQIALEGKSLRAVLREKGMPSSQTFYKWILEDGKSKQYARACEERADAIFEEILTIADEGSNDKIIDPETGKELTNNEVIQRSRLRVDARKWMLSKMQPKKYGDKIDVTTEGKTTITFN